MCNGTILVVEKERRISPKADRRIIGETTLLSTNDKRGDVGNRRLQRSVSRDEIQYIVEVLREEQKTLIDFISDKEQKKQQVFRFQLATIALLGAAMLSALPIYERFITQKTFATSIASVGNFADQIFLVMMVFNVLGFIVIAMINFTSVAVTRQITSLKSNIILAVRQLNCNREAIQDAITARICGAYPLGDWRSSKNIKHWEPANTLYTRHNKFPIDNSGLRNSLIKRHRNWVIRFVSLLFFPLLCFYRRRCKNNECNENSSEGNYANPFLGGKCFKIRHRIGSKEWKLYSFDKYNDVKIKKEDKLPRNWFLRVLLFGYRAAYTRSADMMSVAAMSIITVLIALLIPAGNFYLWYRINIIPVSAGFEENVKSSMIDILDYAYIFSAVDIAIIVIFTIHFVGIIDMAMNKSVSLLLQEPNEKDKQYLEAE